jgi:hypothetical protein
VWGASSEPPTYALVEWLFLRALGGIYLIAFASAHGQILGLIGSNGILPVGEFLETAWARLGAEAYGRVPTLLWLNASDAALQLVCLAGMFLSLLLMLGVSYRLVRVALFLAYLSLASAGQVFMSFQWDVLLIETGFLAIFLGASSIVTIGLFRWLLFRLMFMSAAVKLLSGDPSWRSLTALDYHFETQPLPTVIAWYVHQLPEWFHRLSTAAVFFIEGVVPFLIFAPRRLRLFAAATLVFFQALIFLTGNYTFFNLLSVALCLFLLDDAALLRWLPGRVIDRIASIAGGRRDSLLGRRIVAAVAAAIVFVSGLQLLGILSGGLPEPIGAAINWIRPLRIVNTYGLFAVMTTSRPEIVVEGSNDGQTWRAYEFRYKPGDVQRAPPWMAPHQPRLDWQMWFAALGDYNSNPWFVSFMLRLLQGSPEVLALLEANPFPDAPPRYVRARLYDYHFTDWAGRSVDGAWWRREPLGLYLPAISLRPGSQ